MWLYSTIRELHGRGLRTAATVGIAWWVLQTVHSAKWVAAGFVPVRSVLWPGAVTLPVLIAATAFGAWTLDSYRRTQR